ncbi:universal stress protein [Bacillus sp. JCM 19041]|uniref:universal stress protein n=1 Tax=Bacillus sp. JCM 19041 TaxID=1460637 RepID=UPI0009EADC99
MYKRIVVGVDGSEQSNHAFAKALAIAEASGATLIIGHVMDIRNFPNERLLYSGSFGMNGKAQRMNCCKHTRSMRKQRVLSWKRHSLRVIHVFK